MSALLEFWPHILALLGLIGGALGLYRAGASNQRARSERDALGRDLQNQRTRHEVDRRVDRDPDPAERLRQDWRRD